MTETAGQSASNGGRIDYRAYSSPSNGVLDWRENETPHLMRIGLIIVRQ
jgi:hypothetical protein